MVPALDIIVCVELLVLQTPGTDRPQDDELVECIKHTGIWDLSCYLPYLIEDALNSLL